MSRRVSPKPSVTVTEDERGLRDTGDGKLIFTGYKGRSGAFLMRGGRLLAASFFPEKAADAIGAVYIGKIRHIALNIDACFVETGDGTICFLPLKKARTPFLTNRTFDGRLKEGDEILVQIEREAQKNKQPSVTTQISLANDYFVLTLGSGHFGFSAKLDKSVRASVTALFSEKGLLKGESGLSQEPSALLPGREDSGKLPCAMAFPPLGAIVRTRVGQETEKLANGALLQHFFALTEKMFQLLRDAGTRSCRTCLIRAVPAWEAAFSNLAYPEEYSEIVTDDTAFYEEVSAYCAEHFPEKGLRLYRDEGFSLSRLYSLESKIEAALKPRVWLRSGGYLVIEPTEALTVIDVNSGKNETGREQGQAVRKLNMEAAEEIAVQLRLRNLSGIILVDFVNMDRADSERELLDYLRGLVRLDHVKTAVVDMTQLGLVEITRKKGNPPLREQLG